MDMWLTPGLGQELHDMIQEHQKGLRSQLEKLPTEELFTKVVRQFEHQ